MSHEMKFYQKKIKWKFYQQKIKWKFYQQKIKCHCVGGTTGRNFCIRYCFHILPRNKQTARHISPRNIQTARPLCHSRRARPASPLAITKSGSLVFRMPSTLQYPGVSETRITVYSSSSPCAQQRTWNNQILRNRCRVTLRAQQTGKRYRGMREGLGSRGWGMHQCQKRLIMRKQRNNLAYGKTDLLILAYQRDACA